MYTSTPCLTSRHTACCDLACRCRCHQKTDDSGNVYNTGPSLRSVSLQTETRRLNWRDWNKDAAVRRLVRAGAIKPEEGPEVGPAVEPAIGPADEARLSDPDLHPCAYCGKPTPKYFTICDECFDTHERGKTAEERRE